MSTAQELEPLKGLDEHLARWVADGVVSPVQAEAIRAEEHALAPVEERRTSMVTEALGYVGGVLVVVASILLAATVWDDLSVNARLGLVGAAAALLVGVGALMPAEPGSVGERVRSAVWVLSTGATAFFLGRLANDKFDLTGADVGVFLAAGSALQAALLWRASRMVAQQVVFAGALAATAATSLAEIGLEEEASGSVPALGILAVGVAWLLLAGRGPLVPLRAARVLGAVGLVIGATVVQAWDWTRPVSLLAVAGLVAFAVWRSDLALLAIATVGILAVLPASVVAWFPGAVSAPLALLVTGAVLVLLALRAVRARR